MVRLSGVTVLTGVAAATLSKKEACFFCLGEDMSSSDLTAKKGEESSEEESMSETASSEEEIAALKAKAALWRAWADVLKNWLSFVGLTLLTLVSTVLERAVVAGQVQQIMQLPGQMPLEKVLEHLGTLLGFKAVHLFAEGLRTALQARLGAKLDAEARRIDPSCGEPGRPSGPRLLVAEAGPKLLVEASYALIGAGAALATSPTFAAFYVAHDALMGQLAGLGAASLSAKRDNKMHVLDDIQRSSDIEAYRRVDADVALHDAQNLLDRFADASQLLMVSSFALCSTALIDKTLIDLSTYQKVMVFVSTAMQSTGELAQAFDKVNKGSAHITHLMELEEQTHQNSNSSSSLLSPAT